MQLKLVLPVLAAISLQVLFPAPTTHLEPAPHYSAIKLSKALTAPSLSPMTVMIIQPFPYAPPGTYANPYPNGQCTHLAASMKGNVPIWGDADQWPAHARAAGITVSDTPIVGSLGVERVGNHVVVVTAVNLNGTVTVEEGNYDYNGSIRSYTYPIGKFMYIYM